MKMKRWNLMPNSFGYRVEFRFVNEAGTLLKSKTWELRRERTTPAKALLLQTNAKPLSMKPKMEDLGAGYVAITTAVSEISGEFAITVFDGFGDPDKINRQLSAYPLTIGVVLDADGLHFTLHTTK
jgi:hypothetical protein